MEFILCVYTGLPLTKFHVILLCTQSSYVHFLKLETYMKMSSYSSILAQ